MCSKITDSFNLMGIKDVTIDDRIDLQYYNGFLMVKVWRKSTNVTEHITFYADDTFDNLRPLDIVNIDEVERNRIMKKAYKEGMSRYILAEIFCVSDYYMRQRLGIKRTGYLSCNDH